MPRSTDDWDYLLTICRNEFLNHEAVYPKTQIGPFEYTGDHNVYPYLDAMQIFAADRDKAVKYSQEAQAQGNPYYFNEFMKLAELIQEAGNQKAVSNGATSLLFWESRYGELHWSTLCLKLKEYGRPLYRGAITYKFDENIVRDRARLLVTRSLDQLENGYIHIPSELWNAPPDGTVKREADEGLGWVEMVREEAEYFRLTGEYSRATDLMNRYLKATICLLSNGHQWYLNLSNKHNLSDARHFIEGFYAKLFGKVEIETGEEKLPAAGAKITVTDPHDNRTWETETDQEGHYEFEDAILHNLCSPFNIAAEYMGIETESQYNGPLTQPNPSTEHEKNLLLELPEYEAHLETTHNSRSITSYSEENRDYQVALIIELETTTPPPSPYSYMNQNNVEITSIKVDTFKGEITLVEGPAGEKVTKTWKMVDARYMDPRGMTPQPIDVPWISTFRWETEKETVSSVMFPAFPVKLEWVGPPDAKGPPTINVGPVSDREDEAGELDQKVDTLQGKLGDMGLDGGGAVDFSKIGDLMSMMSSLGSLVDKVMEASTPPDYRVSHGDGVKHFGGGGEKVVEERDEDSYYYVCDTFRWEIKRRPR